jgi:hypothetical protein
MAMEVANFGAKSTCMEHHLVLVAMEATLHARHHFRMACGSFFYPGATHGHFASLT